MRHQHYKEQLQLLIYDELSDDERSALEHHLTSCNECRAEVESLKQFHSVLLQHTSSPPIEQLLTEARQELRAALRLERSGRSLWDRVMEFFQGITLPSYRIVLGGLAIFAAGVIVGPLFFSHEKTATPPLIQQTTNSTAYTEDNPRITNVHFIDSDASDGEIEFTFDAVAPVHIKGSINDDRIQKVLTHALVNDQNPGNRLRSINAFATQVQSLRSPDREVKAALITALISDENPGVRKEALRVLQTFAFDSEIKNAFLNVLMHDKNPGLRIAAINSLDSTRVEGQLPTQDILTVLKERMQSDENNYVRIRAKAVLQEAK